MAANHPHYRSQFGDTTYTKVFVGGLAWETPTDVMRTYFEQFGDILEAVVITDKLTGKSKGYGFVTFRDPESARKACVEPNPVIDGRRANCNIASLGRPRPSPPRARPQGSSPYHAGGAPYSSGIPGPLPPPPPPPVPPSMIYPPYGYPTYTNEYGFTQGLYSPIQQAQYYHQMYGVSSSSSTLASPGPYYYGYSLQPPAPRGSYSSPPAHRIPGSSYLYYPAHMDPSSSFPTYPPSTLQPIRHPFYSSTDSQAPHPSTTETDGGVSTSERSST